MGGEPCARNRCHGPRPSGSRGPRGWAFRDVTFDAEPGSLIAIEGPSGSGRTCLLLALTGRMKATEGAAAVGECAAAQAAGGRAPGQRARARRRGHRSRPRADRRASTCANGRCCSGGSADSLRGLLRPRAERAAEAGLRIDTALTAAGLDLEALPKGSRTAVRDLERLEALRLSVALALIGAPAAARRRRHRPEALGRRTGRGLGAVAVARRGRDDRRGGVQRGAGGRRRRATGPVAATGSRCRQDVEPPTRKETADALAETGRA